MSDMKAGLYEVSPRQPFVAQVEKDSFLCYRMEPALDRASPEAKLRSLLWGKVSIPSFVVVGEPKEGCPVYRVGQGFLGGWPYWPVASLDVGPVVGFLSRTTLEEARAHAGLEASFEDEDGVEQSASELPVEIGDRKVWYVAPAPFVTLSGGQRVFSAMSLQEIGVRLASFGVPMVERFSTCDISFSDPEAARVEVRRRLLASFPVLEGWFSKLGEVEDAVEAAVASALNDKVSRQGSPPS